MSWDVMVMDAGWPTPPQGDIDESVVRPLGTADEVRTWISEQLSGTDWSEPEWGCWEGDDGARLELHVDEDPMTLLMVSVRGAGDPVTALLRLAAPRGWSVYDPTTDDWLDPGPEGSAGWTAFQAYRDQVTRDS